METKCRFCAKKISGQSDKQIDRLLLIHIVSKHPEMIKIKEVKK